VRPQQQAAARRADRDDAEQRPRSSAGNVGRMRWTPRNDAIREHKEGKERYFSIHKHCNRDFGAYAIDCVLKWRGHGYCWVRQEQYERAVEFLQQPLPLTGDRPGWADFNLPRGVPGRRRWNLKDDFIRVRSDHQPRWWYALGQKELRWRLRAIKEARKIRKRVVNRDWSCAVSRWREGFYKPGGRFEALAAARFAQNARVACKE